MRTRPLLILALAASAALSSAQVTLFSDGFEGESGSGLNYNSFVNWNATDGTVDLLASGGNLGSWVDLDGSSSNAALFATKSNFNFVAGTVYTLSFDYFSTGNSNTADVTVGSNSFVVTTSSGAWQTFSSSFSFASNTSANLVFADRGNDNVGMGIDNVRITSPVPEPATLAALGLGAAALLRRRRSAR